LAVSVLPLSVPSARTKVPPVSAVATANLPFWRIEAWLVSTRVVRRPETTVMVLPAGAPLMIPVTFVVAAGAVAGAALPELGSGAYQSAPAGCTKLANRVKAIAIGGLRHRRAMV